MARELYLNRSALKKKKGITVSFYFFNVATRKLYFIHVAHVIFWSTLYFGLCVNKHLNKHIVHFSKQTRSGLLLHPGQSWQPGGSGHRALGWAARDSEFLTQPGLWPQAFTSPGWSWSIAENTSFGSADLTTTQSPFGQSVITAPFTSKTKF